MKTRIVTAAMSLLTLAAVAQKDQVKNAEDAIDDQNYAEAKAQLKVAEANLGGLNDKWKENFYLYKGQAYMAGGTATSMEDLKTAAQALQTASEMGNEDATKLLGELKNSLIESAIEDQNNEKFEESAEKLYTSYQLSKTDTVYLYHAANSYVQAENYDKAVEYLEMLNELNYDGSEVQYTAVNVETGATENLGSKQQRDLMVKTGNYKDPKDEKIPSKKGDIAQLIARIYINQEKYDQAVEAMEKAKATNPDDMSLIKAEANMYYRMGEKDKAREILEDLATKTPDDAETMNNIGLMYAEIGDIDNAVKYYQKAVEIDNSYNQARINMIAAMLSKERAIVDEMNGLGMSKADNAKYEELDEKRKDLYKSVIPYLEAAIEADPNDTEVIRTAMNIYSSLGNQEKVEELKAKLNQ